MEAERDNFINPSRLYILESYIEIKINLNFYFRTSFWCLKRFYEGLNGIGYFGTLRVNLLI